MSIIDRRLFLINVFIPYANQSDNQILSGLNANLSVRGQILILVLSFLFLLIKTFSRHNVGRRNFRVTWQIQWKKKQEYKRVYRKRKTHYLKGGKLIYKCTSICFYSYRCCEILQCFVVYLTMSCSYSRYSYSCSYNTKCTSTVNRSWFKGELGIPHWE
jgi:hypothetical protein